jgi:large subunit ribosomal protein L29
MKASEVRELTTDEMASRIDGLEEELFRLRFRRATMGDENPMLLRTIRRDIARLKTILRERELTSGGAR